MDVSKALGPRRWLVLLRRRRRSAISPPSRTRWPSTGVRCLQAFSERLCSVQVAGSDVVVELRRADLELLGVNGVERGFELFDVALDFVESGVAHTALAAGRVVCGGCCGQLDVGGAPGVG